MLSVSRTNARKCINIWPESRRAHVYRRSAAPLRWLCSESGRPLYLIFCLVRPTLWRLDVESLLRDWFRSTQLWSRMEQQPHWPQNMKRAGRHQAGTELNEENWKKNLSGWCFSRSAKYIVAWKPIKVTSEMLTIKLGKCILHFKGDVAPWWHFSL